MHSEIIGDDLPTTSNSGHITEWHSPLHGQVKKIISLPFAASYSYIVHTFMRLRASCWIYIVTVWIQIISASTFFELRFSLYLFIYFFCSAAIVDFVNCEQCIRVLFTVPQITLFSHFLLKMGLAALFTLFKNYFATVFSVSIFSFSKNKLNPNTPYSSLTFVTYKPTSCCICYNHFQSSCGCG